MVEIHCHACGGFIDDPSSTSYQLPADLARVAEPRSGLCTCGSPTVYGPPPGYASSPGVPAVRVGALGEPSDL